MTHPAPAVSVVVAFWPEATGLARCLAALEPQLNEHVEIFAVGIAPPPAELVQQHPRARWLTAPAHSLIPHLWSQGMIAARGDVVAITTAHFEPAPDWIPQIREAHQRLAAAGIGGPIDPPRGGSAADWATYFLRYSAYFRYRREEAVPDIAGDNASYKRAALCAHPDFVRRGFWEPTFHRLLRSDGETLAFVPAIRITQRASFGICGFCAQRLEHGRHFGIDRMRGKPLAFRLAGIAGSPLVPLLLLGKIAGRVLRKPRYLGPFAKSLPVLSLFIGSWALGELWGYLSAARAPATGDAPSHASV